MRYSICVLCTEFTFVSLSHPKVCPAFQKYKTKNAAWTLTWQAAGAFAQQEGLEVVWQMNAAVGLVCGPSVAAALAAKFITTAAAAGNFKKARPSKEADALGPRVLR